MLVLSFVVGDDTIGKNRLRDHFKLSPDRPLAPVNSPKKRILVTKAPNSQEGVRDSNHQQTLEARRKLIQRISLARTNHSDFATAFTRKISERVLDLSKQKDTELEKGFNQLCEIIAENLERNPELAYDFQAHITESFLDLDQDLAIDEEANAKEEIIKQKKIYAELMRESGKFGLVSLAQFLAETDNSTALEYTDFISDDNDLLQKNQDYAREPLIRDYVDMLISKNDAVIDSAEMDQFLENLAEIIDKGDIHKAIKNQIKSLIDDFYAAIDDFINNPPELEEDIDEANGDNLTLELESEDKGPQAAINNISRLENLITAAQALERQFLFNKMKAGDLSAEDIKNHFASFNYDISSDDKNLLMGNYATIGSDFYEREKTIPQEHFQHSIMMIAMGVNDRLLNEEHKQATIDALESLSLDLLRNPYHKSPMLARIFNALHHFDLDAQKRFSQQALLGSIGGRLRKDLHHVFFTNLKQDAPQYLQNVLHAEMETMTPTAESVYLLAREANKAKQEGKIDQDFMTFLKSEKTNIMDLVEKFDNTEASFVGHDGEEDHLDTASFLDLLVELFHDDKDPEHILENKFLDQYLLKLDFQNINQVTGKPKGALEAYKTGLTVQYGHLFKDRDPLDENDVEDIDKK